MRKLFLFLLLLVACCGSANPLDSDVKAISVAIPQTMSYEIYTGTSWIDAGTAVVYKPGAFRKSEIVTAAHVALLYDEMISRVCYLEAPSKCFEVTGYKLHKQEDLAVLTINEKVRGGLIGTSEHKLGDPVYVLGYPLGSFHVSLGIITRLESNVVFTDARCLPGNSGSPAVDENGRLIGIVSAIRVLPSGQLESNMCYMIPVEKIKEIE